jgi:hypothetical protein
MVLDLEQHEAPHPCHEPVIRVATLGQAHALLHYTQIQENLLHEDQRLSAILSGAKNLQVTATKVSQR